MVQCNRPWELLRDYAQRGDEQAFSQLVAEHLDIVYSTALRLVRHKHLAEEVTQTVFIILARKAGTIRPDVVLSAWLHKTTRYAAMNLLRIEARRQAHERKAAEMASEFPRVDSSWERLSPMLDAGIARLKEKDRAAIMLRFFEHKSVAETADALGLTEQAAAMRIHRAVEKLRTYFHDRRIYLPGSALGGVIWANSVETAPGGMATTVAHNVMQTIAGAVGTAAAMSAADAVIHAMAVAKAKAAAMMVTAALAAALVAGVFTNYLLSGMLRHLPAREPTSTSVQSDPVARMRSGFVQRQTLLSGMDIRLAWQKLG